MDQNQTVIEFRDICIEEAVNFKVPPALIEILFIRNLFKFKEHRHLITDYLKSGALFRFLENWNGPFEVVLFLDQPAIRFADGITVGADMNQDPTAYYRWERVIHLLYMDIMPSTRDQIIRNLVKRIGAVLCLSYA